MKIILFLFYLLVTFELGFKLCIAIYAAFNKKKASIKDLESTYGKHTVLISIIEHSLCVIGVQLLYFL